ncbi:TPA: hypothetical protein ACP2SD_004752, partial [Escherichia coli]
KPKKQIIRTISKQTARRTICFQNTENRYQNSRRYRINRRGTQVVDFDPTCVRTFYNVDQLKLLEDNKTGES